MMQFLPIAFIIITPKKKTRGMQVFFFAFCCNLRSDLVRPLLYKK